MAIESASPTCACWGYLYPRQRGSLDRIAGTELSGYNRIKSGELCEHDRLTVKEQAEMEKWHRI